MQATLFKFAFKSLDPVAAVTQLDFVWQQDERELKQAEEKRKLQLKDKITFIEARLEPDIPA